MLQLHPVCGEDAHRCLPAAEQPLHALAGCEGSAADSSCICPVQAESYTAADAGTMELPDSEEAAVQAKNDPFARLEKGVEDKQRGREGAERIAELREDSAAKYQDDYTMNKALRRQLRYAPSPAA